MSDNFDAYYRWLGIRPEQQPPSHYRLLGITLFEDDPDVILDAAERQMAHVKTYQLGRHIELSQKILNELAAAKCCLFDPEEKAAYDSWLRSQSEQAPPPPAPSPVAGTHRPVFITGILAAGVLVAVIAVVAALNSRKSIPPGQTKTDVPAPIAKHQTKPRERIESGPAKPPAQVPSQPPSPVAPAPTTTPSPAPPPGPPPARPGPEPLQMAKARLEKALKEARTASEFQTLGNEALVVAERAFEAGDNDIGKAIATIAISASRSSGDTDLMRKAALAFVKGSQRKPHDAQP